MPLHLVAFIADQVRVSPDAITGFARRQQTRYEHLAALKSLELLDIWSVPNMSDATLDVIATLPHLKELTIRSTGVSDASIDKILGMSNLQSLTFKENGSVTSEGLKKLASRKWSKLDLGASSSSDETAP